MMNETTPKTTELKEDQQGQQQLEQQDIINLTREQYETLKKSAEVSLASMLSTLDEYDELLGESLNILKVAVDKLDEDKEYSVDDSNFLKNILNHTIQIFLRRYNIKMQISSKFTTSKNK